MAETHPADSIQFRVLGAVEVLVGGRVARIGSPMQRELLAHLLITVGRPRSIDSLVESLWGVGGWERGEQRLWFHISKLRKYLDADAVIERFADGYRLLVDPAFIDANVFEASVDNAIKLGSAEPVESRKHLSRAAALWRDRPYQDVRDSDPVWLERARLDELRHRSILLSNDLDLLNGVGAAMVHALTDLNTKLRYDDRIRLQLMCALVQARRPFDALEVFEAARSDADEEFGGVVASELEAAAALVEEGRDPTIILRSGASGWSRSRPVIRGRGELPRHRTALFDQDSAIRNVTALLDSHQLVTITGPGGVGKTRLGVEVASRMRSTINETRYVDLVPATGETVESIVGEALDIRSPGALVREAIVAHLSITNSLLVLDNCEHVIASIHGLVDELLDRCPSVTILCTSRERLAVDGESVFSLRPLSFGYTEGQSSSAVELLADRAGFDPRTLDSANLQLAHELCRRLDGLPLAIELAAGKIAPLGLADLIGAIEDRMPLRASGAGVAGRHSSLDAAIDWSFSRLTADQQEVLVRYARFSGPFTAADAVGVANAARIDRGTSLTALVALVDGHLVVREDNPFPYRMLETVRQFCGDLPTRGIDSRAGHADHFVAKAQAARSTAFGPDEAVTIDRVLGQAGDYMQALDHLRQGKNYETLAELIAHLAAVVFWCRGRWIEPFAILAEPGVLLHEFTTVCGGDALAAACATTWNRGDLDHAERLLDRAIEIAPEQPHPRIQATFVAMRRGDFAAAVEHGATAVALANPDEPDQILPALNAHSSAASRNGEPDAHVTAARGLQCALNVGSLAMQAAFASQELVAAQARGADTEQMARSAIDLARDAGSPVMECTSMHALIQRVALADVDRAIRLLGDMINRFRLANGVSDSARCVAASLSVLVAQGNNSKAFEFASRMQAWPAAIGSVLPVDPRLRDLLDEVRRSGEANPVTSIDPRILLDELVDFLSLMDRFSPHDRS